MADGNIFISYRRGSDSNAAGRLYDRLERHFDSAHLYFDIDSIPLGVDFAEHIDRQVAQCDVQLVVIGPGWLDQMERLEKPDDFVRIEIEAALNRPDIPVIPVLFGDVQMPDTSALPESLRPLLRRNAIKITHADFADVVDGKLTEALKHILGEDQSRSSAQGPVTAPRLDIPDPVTTTGSEPAQSPESRMSGPHKPAAPANTGKGSLKRWLLYFVAVLVVAGGLWGLYPGLLNMLDFTSGEGKTSALEAKYGFQTYGKGTCHSEDPATDYDGGRATLENCFSLCNAATSCVAVTHWTSTDRCLLHMRSIRSSSMALNEASRICYVKKTR